MHLTHRSAKRLFAVFLLAAGARLAAQTVPAENPPTNRPAPAADDEPLELSPFVVSAEEDSDSYAAQYTLAGTRIRTDLKDVGSSITVVTQKFLQDTNSTNADKLLVYAPSTEVGGQGGNFLGRGDGAILTGTPIAVTSTTRVRGLVSADNTRDFYLTDIPWDSYNTGRIDLQRGPNSILFGIGSPAGIINGSLNTPTFKTAYRIENQVGSYGTMRWSADLNQVVIPDQLAVRVAGVSDHTKYRQDPAFRDDERVYGALRWEPDLFRREDARTSIRASFEKGRIDANLPRMTPPLDAITPWFSLIKRTYDPATFDLATRSSTPALDAPSTLRSFGAIVTVSPAGQQEHSIFGPAATGAPNYLPAGIATFDQFAAKAGAAGGFPFTTIGAYKAKSLTDPSIFDFSNNLLEGPNKFSFNDFKAYNLTVSQTFFNDKLGVEAAYDKQEVYAGGFNYLNDSAVSVTLDINDKIPYGVVNPNVLRPFFTSNGGSGNWVRKERESWRATVFGEVNFADLSGKDSWIAKILGKNTFTGLATKQTVDTFQANYTGFYAGETFARGDFDPGPDYNNGEVFVYSYLGARIPNTTSASGLNLQGLKGYVAPVTSTVVGWNTATNSTATIEFPIINNVIADDRGKTYNGGVKNIEETTSFAVVWQGYWLGGTIIPMVGLRSDEQEARDAGIQPLSTPGSARADRRNVWDPKWRVPDNEADIPNTYAGRVAKTKVNSQTYSIVTHLPKSWRDRLPGRLDVSLLYNQSENIRPEAGRRDIMGDPVGNPSGKTKEYGVAFTGFDDRVYLKIAHFKTEVSNATIGGSGLNYMIPVGEGWAQDRAWQVRRGMESNTANPDEFWRSRIYGFNSAGKAVFFMPAKALPPSVVGSNGELTYPTPPGYYSQAELDAAYNEQKAAVDAWFSYQLPDKFIETWGLTDYKNGTNPGNPQVSGDFESRSIVVTGDTLSEGHEFELVARPIKGLNVILNASKIDATRQNLGKTFSDFVESRWEFFQGPAGDIRLWGAANDLPNNAERSTPTGVLHGGDGESIRGKYGREQMSGYFLLKALEGANVPELKPWTFTVTGDYAFQSGALKGFNVGGSYRWLDQNVVGYPVVSNSLGADSFDVDHPYLGSTEGIADFWLGYQRQLNQRIHWRIQLNVRNALANDHLARVTVQPDGSPAAYRIPEPRTWAITNTFDF